ncbi:MgtE intracellular N domain protein [uncultured archaeon]|nr:MgtE intracellular N domain protein [uncultured archaeon]
MNENGLGNNLVEQPYYLSEILGARVTQNGKKIGKLADMVINDKGKLPEVTQFYVTRSFGNPSLLIPWVKVVSITPKEIAVDIESLGKYEGEPSEETVLLKDHILDKKVLDMEDREVEVVYDVKMALRNNKLYASEVDLSKYGLLRRMGLKRVANFIYRLADKIRDQPISWTYIQPLPTQISSFRGDVKLKVLKERLADIPPVDLADILEELDPQQRIMLFAELDTEHASDTLEEIDPNVQRQLLASLRKEKVVQLINEMTPGQAADVLSALPFTEAKAIIRLLNKEKSKKIKSILEKQEEKIQNFATVNLIKFDPDDTAEEVRKEFHIKARDKDVVMYMYVVDGDEKLLGVIDIKELMQAKDDAHLKDIMSATIIDLKPESTLKDAYAIFARYGFRAIPITDENGKLMGAVPYRDVMNLTHRFLE